MTIQVIGAGFGRTGTASLKMALETLGFAKCYHMREVFENPQHAPIWEAAYHGKPVDWNALFQGYRATVDWPGCTFYKELLRQYPDAKVILSVRDPDKWYASVMNTIYGMVQTFPISWMRHLSPRMRPITRMQETIIWNGTFHGRFTDKPYALAIFQRHIAEVQQFVPPERLLIYDIKQGWDPLCQFLDVPVPTDQPFPHINDTAEFQQRFRKTARRMWQALAATVITVGVLGALVVRQRRTRKHTASSGHA